MGGLDELWSGVPEDLPDCRGESKGASISQVRHDALLADGQKMNLRLPGMREGIEQNASQAS